MIPFVRPRIDRATIDAVTETLRSGWITTGPRTHEFEERLASYCGAQAVICVSSATSGLELALRWFGVGPGDEVIVPAYTYCATANVVLHVGARPVLVDAADDFCLSIEAVEGALSARTKAVLPVDIGGFPCDYAGLHELLDSPSLRRSFLARGTEQATLGRPLLLADAAHSLGATQDGRPSGSLADLTVFSFHAVKNLTTGEGGAIAVHLADGIDAAGVRRSLEIASLHGQDRDALEKLRRGSWKYDVITPGYSYNMTDLQAAMGLVELARYDTETLPRRREIFRRYDQAFRLEPRVRTPEWQNERSESSCHLYLLGIPSIDEPTRDRIVEAIFARGVAVNVHYQPLPRLTCYARLGYREADYPRAFELYESEVTLPVYYDLRDDEVDRVVESVRSALDEVIGAQPET